MGIINQNQSAGDSSQGITDSNRIEYMAIEKPTPPPAGPVSGVPSSPSRYSPRRHPQSKVRYNPVRDYPSSQQRRNSGVRRTRRSENLNFLLGLAEREDGVEDLTDLVEPTVTAFSELFMEHEKMKVWNDFINRTEEDQERLLHTSSMQSGERSTNDHGEGSATAEASDDSEGWEDLGDHRSMHPGYTADVCFKRIDSKLQSFLKRRQVPKGTLEFLEADVTSFFHDWPSSVLVSKLSSSFERLMLHALCQYLDLSSHSFDDVNGDRQTEVENKHKFFVPPEVTLTQFLETKH